MKHLLCSLKHWLKILDDVDNVGKEKKKRLSGPMIYCWHGDTAKDKSADLAKLSVMESECNMKLKIFQVENISSWKIFHSSSLRYSRAVHLFSFLGITEDVQTSLSLILHLHNEIFRHRNINIIVVEATSDLKC